MYVCDVICLVAFFALLLMFVVVVVVLFLECAPICETVHSGNVRERNTNANEESLCECVCLYVCGMKRDGGTAKE